MPEPTFAHTLVAMIAAAVAAVTDLRDRKIYNWLTLPLWIIGPLLQVLSHGWPGLVSSGLGAVVSVLVLLGLTVVVGPGLGGGDVKLVVGLGAVVGWPAAGWLLLYTGLASLLVSAATLWRYRRFRVVWQSAALRLLSGRAGGLGSGQSVCPPVPYGVAVFVGTVAAGILGPLR